MLSVLCCCISFVREGTASFVLTTAVSDNASIRNSGLNHPFDTRRTTRLCASLSEPQPKQSYPTNEEQLSWLADASELRRLKKVEMEQRQTKKTAIVPKLAICRASGYGDDLDAYEQALERGSLARERLITQNMGLVYYCAKDILASRRSNTMQSLSREDLIQEGAIGLSRAVDRWNVELGGKFSTYAVYWIRAAILRGIAEKDDLIRVPVSTSSQVSQMLKAARQLGLDNIHNLLMNFDDGDDEYSSPTAWETAQAAKKLAEAAGLSRQQLVRAAQVHSRRTKGGGILSFESWMIRHRGKEQPDLSSSSADFTGTSSSSLSSPSLDLDDLRQELAKFLRPKEAEALSWRYGLLTRDYDADDDGGAAAVDGGKREKSPNDSSTTTKKKKNSSSQLSSSSSFPLATPGKSGEAMSFVEVGKRMHVSAEYGRRLCQRALEKLRMAHEKGFLEPLYLTSS